MTLKITELNSKGNSVRDRFTNHPWVVLYGDDKSGIYNTAGTILEMWSGNWEMCHGVWGPKRGEKANQNIIVFDELGSLWAAEMSDLPSLVRDQTMFFDQGQRARFIAQIKQIKKRTKQTEKVIVVVRSGDCAFIQECAKLIQKKHGYLLVIHRRCSDLEYIPNVLPLFHKGIKTFESVAYSKLGPNEFVFPDWKKVINRGKVQLFPHEFYRMIKNPKRA